jgi:hypothetical protein
MMLSASYLVGRSRGMGGEAKLAPACVGVKGFRAIASLDALRAPVATIGRSSRIAAPAE